MIKAILMCIAKRWPNTRLGFWAYRKCMKMYMAKDPMLGYFRFSQEYLKGEKKC